MNIEGADKPTPFTPTAPARTPGPIEQAEPAVTSFADLLPSGTGVEYPQSVLQALTFADLLPNSEDQAATLLAAEAEDPETFIDRHNAAKVLAEEYGVPLAFAFNNIDELTKKYFGKSGVSYKTAAKAIADSVRAGLNMVAIGALNNRLSGEKNVQALERNIYKSIAGESEEPNLAAEVVSGIVGNIARIGSLRPVDTVRDNDISSIEAEIKALEDELSELTYDEMPRDWLVSWTKAVGQFAGYPAYFTLAAGAAAGAAAVVPASAPANASMVANTAITGLQMLKAFIAVGLPAAQSRKVMQGLDYSDMIKSGLPHEYASVASDFTSLANTFVESAVGIESAITGISSKGLAGSIFEKWIRKLSVSGGISAIGTAGFARLAANTVGEGIEEAWQAANTGAGMALAQAIAEENGVEIKDPMTAKKWMADIVENFLASITTAPVIGIGPSIVATIQDKKAFKELTDKSLSMTKESFTDLVVETKLLPDSLNEAARIEIAGEVYAARRMQAISDAEKAKALADVIAAETASPVERKKGGSLRYSTEQRGDDATSRTVSYDFGSARTDTRYASVDVRVEEGKAIIEDAVFESGYEHLADEVLFEVASNYSDREVVVSDTAPEGLTESFEQAKKMGLGAASSIKPKIASPLDSQARQQARLQLSRAGFMSRGQVELGLDVIQIAANASDRSFAQVIDSMDSEFIRVGDTKAMKAAKAVGAASVMDGAKSIIYLAENANFATLVHEFGHVTRGLMAGSADLASIEEAYGIKDGKWSKKNEERFTKELMAHIVDGAEAHSTIKRIAEWLKMLWKGSMQKLDLDPRVKAVFEKWTANDVETVQEKKAPLAIENKVTLKKERGKRKRDPQLDGDADTAVLAEQVLNSKNDLLFMAESEINTEEYVIPQAADFATAKEWAETYGEWDKFTADEKKWFEARHAYATSGKKKQFSARGSFAKYLSEEGRLEDFINRAEFAMYGDHRQLNKEGLASMKRIRDAVVGTPELVKLVDQKRKGGKKNVIAERSLIAFVKRNEAVVKALYGEMTGDQNLIDEALNDISYVPEIKKRRTLIRPDRSLREKGDILNAITNKALREKIDNESITMTELKEYLAGIELNSKDKSKKAVDKYRKRAAERKALAKLAARMRKLRAYIMQKPRGLDLEGYVTLAAIQDYLANKGDISQISTLNSRLFQRNPAMLKGIISFMEELGGKDYENWTAGQLEEMADFVELITKGSRTSRRERELSFGINAQDSRRAILETYKLKKNAFGKKDYIDPQMVGGEEAKANEEKKRLRLIAELPFMRVDVFVSQVLENGLASGANGEAMRLLVDETINAQRKKLTEMTKRTAEVKAFINEKVDGKRRVERLNDTFVLEGVGPNDGNVTVTRNSLIGIRLMVGTKDRFNDTQRRAFIEGNLFSSDKEKRIGQVASGEEADEYMIEKSKEKLEYLLAYLDKNMSADDEKLASLILKATDSEESWGRFADAVIDITDKEPTKEKYYFPIFRLGEMQEKEDMIADLLKSKGNYGNYLKTGMTIDRSRKIAPHNQKPVRIEATSMFFDSVEHQEHLIAFGKHAKTLQAVFGSAQYSTAIRDAIQANAGREGLKYLDDFISLATNPASFEPTEMGSAFIRILRGSVVQANLAWRWSTILSQVLTSPLPFIAHTSPGMLMSVAAEAAISNPMEWYKKREDESAILKNRQMDEVKELIETMGESGLKRFNQIGMKGLEYADRITVAIGWEAVRRQRLKDFPQYGEFAAKEYADKVVIRDQPSSDPLYRAPIYRQKSEALKLILQFTQPLNVIWQNIRYDMPKAVKEKEYARAVGYIAAYALSGLAIGLVRSLRGYGPDDDDDSVRYWTHAATSQFTESIPLAGEAITALTRYLITGNTMYMPDNNLPALTDAINGVMDIKRGDLDKALWSFGTAAMQTTGLPARTVLDTKRFIEGVNGNP